MINKLNNMQVDTLKASVEVSLECVFYVARFTTPTLNLVVALVKVKSDTQAQQSMTEMTAISLTGRIVDCRIDHSFSQTINPSNVHLDN